MSSSTSTPTNSMEEDEHNTLSEITGGDEDIAKDDEMRVVSDEEEKLGSVRDEVVLSDKTTIVVEDKEVATANTVPNLSSEVDSSSISDRTSTKDDDDDDKEKGEVVSEDQTVHEPAMTIVNEEARAKYAEESTQEAASRTVIIEEDTSMDLVPEKDEARSSSLVEDSTTTNNNPTTVDSEEGTQEVEKHPGDDESITEIPPPPPPPRAASLQPPPPPPLPPNAKRRVATMDSAKRTALHHKLRAYEANRRVTHSTKLSSSSLYWKSFRALIHSSLEETKRSEGMIKAHVIADANYAQHMKAIFFNFLNDDGAPLLDHKKRLQQQQQQKKDRTEAGAPSSPFSAKNPVSSSGTLLLGTMVDSHLVIADRFEETSNGIKQDILQHLTPLREKFEQEVKTHEALGNAILEDLEFADHAVGEAWESYYTIAVKSLSSGTNDRIRSSLNSRRRRTGAATSTSAATEVSAEELTVRDANDTDVWLAEMKYRVAVAYASSLWEKASTELSRLFTRLKEVECQRRFRLAELLHSDMKKRECLFLSLPSILTPSLHEFANRPMDHASIEDDVQTSIRIRAQQMKKAEVEAKKATTTSKHHDNKKESASAASGLAGVDTSHGKFELTSPLTSELLCKTKVVDRKVSGVIFDGWKPSLAVVTVDYFLHFFDIVTGPHKIGCNSAPEVAFHTMLPPITIPTEENIHTISSSGQPSSHQRAWTNHLSPSLSINLSNSIISLPDSISNSTKSSNSYLLEITETYFNHGASKVFGKTSVRKVQIRTSTREEILDWVACLMAEG